VQEEEDLDGLARWWQVVPTILVPSNIPLYGGKVTLSPPSRSCIGHVRACQPCGACVGRCE